MLSAGAFNALLKTLEEPPEHVKFILATTEPQKLPATILSRCQRFDFKQVSNEDIIKRLKIVCSEMKIEITQEALNIIAMLAEGGMRDALSILERCIQDGDNKIDEDKIKDLVGIPKLEYINKLTLSMIENDVDSALDTVNVVISEGKDISNFLWEMLKYLKDILVFKASKNLDIYSKDELKQIEKLSNEISKEKLLSIIYELSNLENDLRYSSQKLLLFQVEIIKICSGEINIKKGQDGVNTNDNRVDSSEIERLNARINALENHISKMEQQNINNNLKNVDNTYKNSNNIVNNTQNKNNIFNSTATKIKTIVEPVKPSINMENVKTGDKLSAWPKIVSDLKDAGKIMLYSNLLNSTASKIDDLRVAIEFPRGLTPFGKTILEKTESISEIERRVSIECGKPMKIKYIVQNEQTAVKKQENPIESFARGNDIPFNIVD